MEQIYDHQGNLFRPSKDQERLYKAGWRMKSQKRQGMCMMIYWIDPLPQEEGSNLHDVWSQGSAIYIQRQRNKWNKEAKKNADTGANSGDSCGA